MGTHFSGLNLGIRRRQFLQLTAGTAAYFAFIRRGFPYAQSPLGLKKFVQALQWSGADRHSGRDPHQIGWCRPISDRGRRICQLSSFTPISRRPDYGATQT